MTEKSKEGISTELACWGHGGNGEGFRMSVDVLSLLRPVGYLHGALPCYHVLSHELLTWFPVPVFHFAMKSLKGFFFECPRQSHTSEGPSGCIVRFARRGDELT